MEIKNDESFGIIPLQYVDGEWLVFVVEQYNQTRGDSYWTFPKGHAESGETPEATAVRELVEETGLVPLALCPHQQFPMQYTFIHEGVQIQKTVTYFLGYITEPRFQLQASELSAATWLPLADAAEQLSFPNLRALCQAVQTFVGTSTPAEIFPDRVMPHA
jgi:8-oxo-dGTP pyrophosphatase MutT (NUDIX family)